MMSFQSKEYCQTGSACYLNGYIWSLNGDASELSTITGLDCIIPSLKLKVWHYRKLSGETALPSCHSQNKEVSSGKWKLYVYLHLFLWTWRGLQGRKVSHQPNGLTIMLLLFSLNEWFLQHCRLYRLRL